MHITVRMAWHDSNWNGHICQNPEANTYCVGTHSLLSGRIEKKRKLDFEKNNPGKPLAKLGTDEIPPCYWSANAFGKNSVNIAQRHAFTWIKENIPDTLKAYSIFTWPFKLSFVHTEENQVKHGNYWPDLEPRIENFIKKFIPGQSIIFFYLNYDNPVSADEMKYLLLGCSVMTDQPKTTYFPFTQEFLKDIRQPKFKNGKKDITMKNFPRINWAIQLSHNPEQAVLLPYKEYIDYAEENPEDEEKLHEMKVIIEEPSLVRSFKYVAMDIDDDKCLYLLYKLRKSIKKIQEHNQLVVHSDLKEEEKKIEKLIGKVWEKRGIYPCLNKVVDYFLGNRELSDELASNLIGTTDEKNDLSAIFEKIIKGKVPKELKENESDLVDLVEKRVFKKNCKSLLKLGLFNLTQYQIDKIINDDNLLSGLDANPYILYEDYEPRRII